MNTPRLTFLVAAALLTFASAQASTYVGTAYEGFDYTAGSTINNTLTGGSGWNATGDAGSANTTAWGANTTGGSTQSARGVNAPGLVYTAIGYPPSVGNMGSVSNSGIGRTFAQTVDTGSFYFSYLTERSSAATRTLNVAFFNNTTEQFAVGQIGSATADSGGNFALFLANSRMVTASSPLAYNTLQTHLVIGRVDFDSGGNERIRLYIDPANVTDESLLTPYIDDISTNLTAVTQFRMFAGGNLAGFGTAQGDFDEFRFGSTFGSVVTAVPEPASAVLVFGGATAAVIVRRRIRRR